MKGLSVAQQHERPTRSVSFAESKPITVQLSVVTTIFNAKNPNQSEKKEQQAARRLHLHNNKKQENK